MTATCDTRMRKTETDVDDDEDDDAVDDDDDDDAAATQFRTRGGFVDVPHLFFGWALGKVKLMPLPYACVNLGVYVRVCACVCMSTCAL